MQISLTSHTGILFLGQSMPIVIDWPEQEPLRRRTASFCWKFAFFIGTLHHPSERKVSSKQHDPSNYWHSDTTTHLCTVKVVKFSTESYISPRQKILYYQYDRQDLLITIAHNLHFWCGGKKKQENDITSFISCKLRPPKRQVIEHRKLPWKKLIQVKLQ